MQVRLASKSNGYCMYLFCVCGEIIHYCLLLRNRILLFITEKSYITVYYHGEIVYYIMFILLYLFWIYQGAFICQVFDGRYEALAFNIPSRDQANWHVLANRFCRLSSLNG